MSKIIAEEKEYLEYVKEQLEKDIEYNRQQLKEIPKKYTNVLQGDSFLVQGLMSAAATKLRQLENSKERPYFGRIDFLQDDHNKVAKLYIGKTTISGKNNDLATIDWRTPVCSLYYDSEVGRASYEAPQGEINGDLKLKRQIIIDKGEIIDVKDTGLVAQDDLLQEYLDVHADNRMKNIIASIQKEQHKIIRKPLRENIVVQGVAGSGKTSVALHRIAYLIFNESKSVQSNQFLVIGPNKYFLDYISGLLPDLEVESINQLTFLDIAEDVIGEKIKLADPSVALENYFKTDSIDQSLTFKSSLEYKAIVDKFLSDYINSVLNNDIVIGETVIASSEDIKAAYNNSVSNSISGSFDNYQKRLIKRAKDNNEKYYSLATQSMLEQIRSLEKDDPKRAEKIKEMEEIKAEIKTGCRKTIKNHFKKLSTKPLAIYKEFINRLECYIPENENLDVESFKNSTQKSISKKTLEYEDLAAVMHIKLALDGNTDYNQYKQVVLDEAQDLGMFHFDVLKQIFKNGTFSIFGDLNQAIHSYRSISSWKELNEQVFNEECTLSTLDKSYRTTAEIMDDANSIPQKLNLHVSDSLVRHGEKVNYIDSNKEDKIDVITKILCDSMEKGYESIAIISKTDTQAKKIAQELIKKGIPTNYISGKDNKYLGGICSTTSYNSKGLEFDSVVITDASEKEYSSNKKLDLQLLYVAMTRPLHELNVLYDGKITDVLDKCVIKQNGIQKTLEKK